MFHIPGSFDLEIKTGKRIERGREREHTYPQKLQPPWICCCLKQEEMLAHVNETGVNDWKCEQPANKPSWMHWDMLNSGSKMQGRTFLPFLWFLTGWWGGSGFSGLTWTVLHAPQWALYTTGKGGKQAMIVLILGFKITCSCDTFRSLNQHTFVSC